MRTGKDYFKATRRLRAALLTSSALALAWALPASLAHAQDATWGTSPATGSYGDGGNWNTGSVPSGTAYFGTSNVTYPTIDGNATIGGWTFNPGASDYTITNMNGASLKFIGAGITVNGGSLNLNTQNSSTTTFQNSSSAGNATIGNQGTMSFANSSTAASASLSNGNILRFLDNSTAANAVITNNFLMGFSGSSTAGNAAMTNNNMLNFNGTSTAGSATIITGNSGRTTFSDNSTAGNATLTINSGGLLSFYGNSTTANATIINNVGGNIYFSGTGPAGDGKLSAQSLTGAGTSYLDFIELTLGANNQSSELSGTITGTGSLVKAGTGTLTLSGGNSYVGGTTITAGTLQLGTVTTAGSIAGTVDVRSGTTLSLINSNGNGMAVTAAAGSTVDFSNSAGPAGDYRQTVGSIAGAGSYLLGANELTVGSKNTSTELTGVISGTGGSLVKIGAGTLTLAATNTYTGSSTVYDGTLQLGTLARTGSVGGAVGVGAGGALSVVNAGAISSISNAGSTTYSNGMSAGSTAITNSGTLEFVDTTTAGSAQITSTGTANFRNTSSAGNAALSINGGTATFYDTSSASNATINVNNSGTLGFRNSSTAGSATINNSGTLRFGDFSLSENSTAANAIINNSGTLLFVGSSTAASATINNGGSLTFGYASTAGNAAITNTSTTASTHFAGSGPALDGVVSVGSIAGQGTFFVDAQLLKVGGNNTSTVVSGTLSGYGTLEKVGTGTLTLTGTSTYSGNTIIVSNGRLQFGDGSVGGSNNLDGSVNVTGGSLAIETPATLNVAHTVTFGDNTTLSIAAGTNSPALSADSVAIGNGVAFNISGISNASQLDKVLIDTRSGISGDFAAVTVGGFNGTVDYLTVSTGKSADGLQYLASYGLSWTAGNSLAHGTFTLTNASDTFTLGVALTDQAANPATGWDGKSLTKAGAGTLVLTGQNTYSGGTAISAGTLQIGNSGATGSIVGGVSVGAGGTFDVVNADMNGVTGIANSGITNFRNANSAGSTGITNDYHLNFYDTSTAGSATITNNAGLIYFYGTSTAGSANITNNTYGQLSFNNSSSAANANIISGSHGFVGFNNSSTAGSAIININSIDGILNFRGTSTAGSATITNGGSATFYDTSTAGGAVINNNAMLSFRGSSVAGSAVITNTSSIDFSQTSSAAGAAIANNGVLGFSGSSTAASATITNNVMTSFAGASTAGSADIANNQYLFFSESSTAGSARITNNAGATTRFTDNATAGNAQLINSDPSAVFDFSGGTGPNGDNKLGAGSIAGNGTFYLGANALTVGGNNLSTMVSGVITDGGYYGGAGGSLVKTGTGTLTLSGTNSYTGGTIFAGGTVSVSSDANLGDVAGGLTFNGGTLRISGTAFNATARTVNLGAGGGTFDIADAANDFVVSQSISGTTLTKSGAGTLTLTAAAGFSAATVSAGTLAFLSTTAGSAHITNNAQLAFYGNSTAGSATIHNSGNVLFDGNSTAGNAQLINTASSAVINFFTPGPGSDGKITAGSIAGNGRFDLNGAELTVGSNNLSTNVTGVLTGDGMLTGTSLIKVGTGALTLSGVNTYTGATIVDGGTLAVNGSIASSSSLIVNSGGTLGGTGTVGNTTIASGGTLAPGNSVGTITVSGNLAFAAGSFYRVEVSTTAADRTNVAGTARLTGAAVQAMAIPGSFRGQTFTLLNATGGLGGTQFAGLTIAGSFSPARNPRLTYDINNVYLVLDPGKIELPAGASGNQTSVARGINNAVESGATPPAGFDTLLNMSGAQLNRALSEVSGQPGAATTQAAFNAMQQFLGMLDPVGGSMDGERGMSGGTLGYAATAQDDARLREAYAAVTPRDASGDVIDRRWGVWASGYGGGSTLSGHAAAGSSSTASRIYGTVVGADYRLSPDTLIGFALGGAGFNFSVADSLGGGRADAFQAGLYARHNFGAAYLSGALAYGWQDVTTDRTVTVSGTDKLTANFKASTFSGRLEAGWRFAPIPASTFGVTPYAAVQVTTFHLPGYGETAIVGSNQFALSYAAQDTTNVRTELGARTDQRFLVNDGVLTLGGRLAWAHDTNTNRLVSAVFQTLPGAAFTVNGAQPAADSALVGGRAEMKWRNGLSLAGIVEGEFSRSTQTYTGKGTVRYEW